MSDVKCIEHTQLSIQNSKCMICFHLNACQNHCQLAYFRHYHFDGCLVTALLMSNAKQPNLVVDTCILCSMIYDEMNNYHHWDQNRTKAAFTDYMGDGLYCKRKHRIRFISSAPQKSYLVAKILFTIVDSGVKNYEQQGPCFDT